MNQPPTPETVTITANIDGVDEVLDATKMHLLKHVIETQQAEIADLKADLETYKDGCSDLEAELGDLIVKTDRQAETIDRLEAELRRLRAELAARKLDQLARSAKPHAA